MVMDATARVTVLGLLVRDAADELEMAGRILAGENVTGVDLADLRAGVSDAHRSLLIALELEEQPG